LLGVGLWTKYTIDKLSIISMRFRAPLHAEAIVSL
jgi:hypothetical protein